VNKIFLIYFVINNSKIDNNLNFDFSELNTGVYVVKIDHKSNLTPQKLVIKN